MKRFVLIWFVNLLLFCIAMVSCVGTAPTKEVRIVDSLNIMAYSYRYKNLDSLYTAATHAYENVNIYSQGKAEALNNLGFWAFMLMDFEKAERYYNEVYGVTKNELELLVADIGLMKVYQRTAMNKEFYDYRNSALRRMKRIDEDRNLFADKHERLRLNYARSEFFIVSAVYYYYLQQRPEAVASINEISSSEILAADTNQLLYYHYIKGSASLCDGETEDERRLREFDELYTTWLLASRGGYLYFEGNGVQGLANLMASPSNYEFFKYRRSHAIKQFGFPVDSLLPMRLGQLALMKFKQYNDLYQIAGAYVSIGKYLNAHEHYSEALDTLTLALECVNTHHRRFYNCNDSLDWLKTFDISDTISSEKIWIQRKLRTVPEWISRIREQLSVSYSGLEMKSHSDYNRNIYLDILEDTRQDKELESRYLALKNEASQLNILLFVVVVGFVFVLLFFWRFNRRSKERHHIHLSRLRRILDVCQKITTSIPSEAQTEEEIIVSMLDAVSADLEQLFRTKDIKIEAGQLVLHKRLSKDEKAMVRIITPYIKWAIDNGMTSISLGDERRRLEKERYVYEQHIAGNKRQNLIKKTCMAIVNGIHPYIDRIINEVHKLTIKGFINDSRIKEEKYQYMDELVSTINDYNDILTLWIKMKQGSLSLNIEIFELNELFNLIRKGSRTFEMKQQQLEVTPTDAIVKADKALTLFMINTLAENARKYTPKGGCVKVYALCTEQYVEISVEDNGYGLSEADVKRIVGEKLYNSQEIGMSDADHREDVLKNKGSGFGLMNCKGIVEKYRKTNEVFNVCLFDVESSLGSGSRFYFRLPVGVRKSIMVFCCLFLSFGVFSCRNNNEVGIKPPVESESQPVDTPMQPADSIFLTSPDSVDMNYEDRYETLLNDASEFANAAYYSNVYGNYNLTIQYVDSAISCLNEHYKIYAKHPQSYMMLIGEGEPGELHWWNELFDSDFHIILDIRNEAAVAFLALKQWDGYRYNNAAYTTLYKLLGEDQSLEAYCNQLERSTNNKMVGVMLFVGLMVVLLLGYYILYIRKRLVYRWNLEQVLEINKRIFAASISQVSETEEALQQEDDLIKSIPQRIVDQSFDAINELLTIEHLAIAVYNETSNRLEFASSSPSFSSPFYDSLNVAENDMKATADTWKSIIVSCYETQAPISTSDVEALPLIIDAANNSRCIGVVYVKCDKSIEQDTAHLLLELVARYVSIVIFNAVVKLATKYRDIESASEEAYRASWEDSQLHVQNMVLDNCLSTIKHETTYYPNKIKQLIGRLRSECLSDEKEKEIMIGISELIEYYKGIFTILSSCASRQLEEVTFRRGVVPVVELFELAEKYFRKSVKGKRVMPSLHTKPIDEMVVGDFIQLRFLLENLIDEALSVSLSGDIVLEAVPDEDYIRFLFTDKRREKSVEELNQLFYPNLERMTSTSAKGELSGTEYLVCKQIIRDHDEFAGKRGCRINAIQADGGGFTVYFTIPIRKQSTI